LDVQEVQNALQEIAERFRIGFADDDDFGSHVYPRMKAFFRMTNCFSDQAAL
jgi:hypothetical protein